VRSRQRSRALAPLLALGLLGAVTTHAAWPDHIASSAHTFSGVQILPGAGSVDVSMHSYTSGWSIVGVAFDGTGGWSAS